MPAPDLYEVEIEVYADEEPLQGFPIRQVLHDPHIENNSYGATTSYASLPGLEAGTCRLAVLMTPGIGTVRIGGSGGVEWTTQAGALIIIGNLRSENTNPLAWKTSSGTAQVRFFRAGYKV